jgi:hypothetical protein
MWPSNLNKSRNPNNNFFEKKIRVKPSNFIDFDHKPWSKLHFEAYKNKNRREDGKVKFWWITSKLYKLLNPLTDAYYKSLFNHYHLSLIGGPEQ